MYFVDEIYNTTIEVTKSKFISFLAPYEEFDTLLEELKAKHPKARHFIYAYRYLNEYDQVVENCSDDGEPKGTSGKPTLAVLSGAELINSAIITVRYFGGTLLGTGGLVKAYSDSANEVIKEADLKEYKKLFTKDIVIEYSELSKLEYQLNKIGIEIKNKSFEDKVTLLLSGTKEQLERI